MKTKIILLSVLTILLSTVFSIAQTTGKIRGIVTDTISGESLPFVNVIAFQNGVQKNGTTTDFDGAYILSGLTPGKYDVKFIYVGFGTKQVNGVTVDPGASVKLDMEVHSTDEEIEMVEIVIHQEPLIRDKGTSGGAISGDDLKKMGRRNVSHAVNLVGGNASYDDGSYSSAIIQGKASNKRSKSKKNKAISNSASSPISKKQVENHAVQVQKVDKKAGQKEEVTSNSEDYNTLRDNSFKSTISDPLSTFSIDVDAASYTNVRRMINSGMMPPKDAVRVEEFINYFSYDYAQPTDGHPFSIVTEMGDCPWNTKHKLVHVGIQGKFEDIQNLPPMNLVFLIDVSGSMSSPRKLGWVKESMKTLIQNLRQEDNVSIVVYAGAAGLVLPPTSGVNHQAINAALDKLQAGGSTAGGQGLRLAYAQAEKAIKKDGINRIILATDGDFNVGVSSNADMKTLVEEKRDKGIFMTVLGYGMGNYKDSKMEIIADHGNGNYFYIDDLSEAKKVLNDQISSTLMMIAKDVKLQLEFNPALVKSYRLIGYANRLLRNEDFNNDKIDAGDLGAGHTVTAMYELVLNKKSSAVEKSKRKQPVDSLKYQSQKTTIASFPNELMTLKFRYKKPYETKSALIVHTLENKDTKQLSSNFNFSAAVASYGMQLRDSEHKGSFSYEDVVKLAQSAKGKDASGYRTEFIQLVGKTIPLR